MRNSLTPPSAPSPGAPRRCWRRAAARGDPPSRATATKSARPSGFCAPPPPCSPAGCQARAMPLLQAMPAQAATRGSPLAANCDGALALRASIDLPRVGSCHIPSVIDPNDTLCVVFYDRDNDLPAGGYTAAPWLEAPSGPGVMEVRGAGNGGALFPAAAIPQSGAHAHARGCARMAAPASSSTLRPHSWPLVPACLPADPVPVLLRRRVILPAGGTAAQSWRGGAAPPLAPLPVYPCTPRPQQPFIRAPRERAAPHNFEPQARAGRVGGTQQQRPRRRRQRSPCSWGRLLPLLRPPLLAPPPPLLQPPCQAACVELRVYTSLYGANIKRCLCRRGCFRSLGRVTCTTASGFPLL